MMDRKACVPFVRWCRRRCFGVGSGFVFRTCSAGSRDVIWKSPRRMKVVEGWSLAIVDDSFLYWWIRDDWTLVHW